MIHDVAGAIGLKSGALTLRLSRRYLTARGILIASFNWNPADQMIYRTCVRRSKANA